jgi:hypothetical protein
MHGANEASKTVETSNAAGFVDDPKPFTMAAFNWENLMTTVIFGAFDETI